jgi:transcription antitermination factor NusG
MLSNSGIESFLAVVERLRRWKDRKKLVSFPLFPGYVFVHLDKSPRSRLRVLKTNGVVRFVEMTPGKPAHIPEDQINALKTLVENKAHLDPYPYLTDGNRVRIRSGSFTGVEGILIRKRDRNMLVLSVDVLQKGVALSINAHEVEKI